MSVVGYIDQQPALDQINASANNISSIIDLDVDSPFFDDDADYKDDDGRLISATAAAAAAADANLVSQVVEDDAEVSPTD